ncbi:hypothetical protein NQT62_02500 [Limnobacter humi]|uniref:Type II secretion system protein GspC N-terminal domain-containing protein n=1 Tax=Limnobacter humi TaxID=1778671 RepID=A0ABT1WCR0_9BURK|nr:hypothetical protein [Limnobacter humi]MCQ8895309.1 hypothetical protein [Limnobacter humi]
MINTDSGFWVLDLLIGFLISPWLGIADSPAALHAEKMQVIEQRLVRSQSYQAPDPSTLRYTPPPKPPLPAIDGRLLEQSLKGDRVVASTAGPGASKWTMTGLIGAGMKRVAILNDGTREQVVAVGAVLDQQWRVDKVDDARVVLSPITPTDTNRPVTLYLNTPTPNED